MLGRNGAIMTDIDLGGSWTLTRLATGQTYPAQVPGCTHLDLQRAKAIPELAWRDNEAQLMWIGEEDWLYEREFSVPAGASLDAAELVCEGLDTIAEVRINGALVLSADNMHRTWRRRVGAVLRPGSNRIAVRFASPLPTMRQGDQRKRLPAWNIYREEFWGRPYVRKMACAFGWDWGPIAVTAGIWLPIRIELPPPARITDLAIRQEHRAGAVVLRLDWQASAPLAVRARVSHTGRTVGEATLAVGTTTWELAIADPQLWWPNGLGDQPLYDITVTAADGSSSQRRRIGLRTLELVRERDSAGETFVFAVNGVRFFAKGANWVPHRLYLPEVTREDYRRLIDDAADANMNMLRVWGGGIYERDEFYDACDERGVLVWQDCAFACGIYPLAEPDFQATVEAELRDNARRLRHRASLALWCGNNELEQGFAGMPEMPWDLYSEFFDRKMQAWIRAEDPLTPYWPGSPHTPLGDRKQHWDGNSGDAHYWSVWFGNDPFEKQRTWRCRFQSEYGFQSFPDRRTVAAFTEPGDRNLNSRIMDYHQRSQMGNRTIFAYGLDWFPAAEGLDAQLHLSQLTQSTCVRYAAEHLRRMQPHTQGCLFWQINDLWPCASWSAMDAFLRWKVLMYEAKRFFAPVLVALNEDVQARTVAVHVSNHRREDASFTVVWQVTDTDGRELLAGTDAVLVRAQEDRRACLLDLAPLLQRRLAADVLVWARVERDGQVLSRSVVSLARYKHLSLADPQLAAVVGEDAAGVYLDVSCRAPALYVRVDLTEADAWWDDNHLHLQLGETRRLRLRRGPDAATVRAQVRVSSLADHLPGRRAAGSVLPALPATYTLWEKR
jgi:beta-mannosidase